MEHIYFLSTKVTEIWKELSLEQVRLELADKDSAMEIIRDLVKLNEDAQVKVAVLMYFWWNERCRRKKGEPRKNAQTIAHSVRTYAEEIKKQTMTQPNIKGAGQQCWKRPPENMLKLNCDGAYHATTKSGGWGFVIRDDDGAVVKAGCGKIEHAQDVFQVELIACFQAVKYAMEIGVTNIIIESDSLMVKQAATSDAYRLSAFGGLIWELKDLLAMYFSNVVVYHTPRVCNKVAHELAAMGSSLDLGVDLIMDEIPACMFTLVANDLAPCHE